MGKLGIVRIDLKAGKSFRSLHEAAPTGSCADRADLSRPTTVLAGTPPGKVNEPRAQRSSPMNRKGSTWAPFFSTSKCRCGPVECPEDPINATSCPLLTMSPSFTNNFSLWQ